MTMAPPLRRLMLALHLVGSIGWIGALAAFLALAVTGLTTADIQTMRMAYAASAVVTSYVIVPLAIVALATGIIQALGTPWGLVRHCWVLFKLLIVAAATLVLMMKAGPIRSLAGLAAQGALGQTDQMGLRVSILAHAVGGLLILLWAAVLGTYKPKGLTPYGWRRQRRQPLR